MRRETLAVAIASMRDGLADDLAGIDARGWELPFLCAGWAIRDVVGHLVRLADYLRAPLPYAFGSVRHGFRPNRYQYADAPRFAAGRPPAWLTRALREADYTSTWVWRHHPAPEMTLAEFVIHAQDIRRPLGISGSAPTQHLRMVADLIVRRVPKPLRYPLGGWRLPAARLQATDDEWTWGSGPTVSGPLESIVMVLSGRTAASSDLVGETWALGR